MAKSKLYAFRLPNGEQGIVTTWAACDKKVNGVAGARYRSFSDRPTATTWLSQGASYESKPKVPRSKLKPGIYFDAGTGRGHGVEVSVTDERGRDLLFLILPANKINRYGKHRLPGGITNNYGELLGCLYALQIATRTGARAIFGDSKLVLDYWSQGAIRAKDLPPKTVQLAGEVATARRSFEADGGELKHISGAHNPADLGFH